MALTGNRRQVWGWFSTIVSLDTSLCLSGPPVHLGQLAVMGRSELGWAWPCSRQLGLSQSIPSPEPALEVSVREPCTLALRVTIRGR